MVQEVVHDVYRSMNVLLYLTPRSLQQTALDYCLHGQRLVRYGAALRICMHLHKRLKMWPMRDGILFACEHDAVVDLTPAVRPTLREYASETESDDSER